MKCQYFPLETTKLNELCCTASPLSLTSLFSPLLHLWISHLFRCSHGVDDNVKWQHFTQIKSSELDEKSCWKMRQNYTAARRRRRRELNQPSYTPASAHCWQLHALSGCKLYKPTLSSTKHGSELVRLSHLIHNPIAEKKHQIHDRNFHTISTRERRRQHDESSERARSECCWCRVKMCIGEKTICI